MKTIGLLGGMSWESTAVYYRLLNEAVKARLGGLHSARVVLWSYDFADIAAQQAAGDWAGLGATLAQDARRLEAAGAGVVLICTNTMHRVHGAVQDAVGVPVLHIADPTGAAMQAAGVRRPLLLGTRFTMEQAFYRDRLRQRHGIDAVVPDADARAMVHRVIYEELCVGIVSGASRAAYLEVIRASGADAVIFGCTEVGLLLSAEMVAAPVFDTAALHAAAGVAAALG